MIILVHLRFERLSFVCSWYSLPAFWEEERVEGRQPGAIPAHDALHGQGGQARHGEGRRSYSGQVVNVQGERKGHLERIFELINFPFSDNGQVQPVLEDDPADDGQHWRSDSPRLHHGSHGQDASDFPLKNVSHL